jgi:predicted DCC family thiol-disulfide oxidoreductase YuxK
VTAHPLLYDPDCGFCKACVAVLLRWDRHGRLRPVPDEELDSWRLILPDGTVRSAGAAFPPLFRLLPGGSLPAWLTARFPGATERAYRWVAGHRSTIGRLMPQVAKKWADRVISDSARRSR